MALLGEAAVLASKFRGCLVGTVIGDCMGSPFEGEAVVSKSVLQNYFDKLCGPYFNAPVKQYTDDTAMTKVVAESFINQGGYDAVDMAKRFVKEYFLQPRRGYGANVTQVFTKLRATRFTDVHLPAREQFGGMGSFGNGGAMRIAPVALYFHGNKEGPQLMLDVARQVTELTHTHRDAINGAILQCMAVEQCLRLDSREPLDGPAFIEGLRTRMESIEEDEEGLDLEDTAPYHAALGRAKDLIKNNTVTDHHVQSMLGNDVSALHSVPTAIFCFVHAHKHNNIEGIKTDDPFRRILQYAISIGGDTDTIASMAGALAGAFYGYEKINESLQKHCEACNELSELGQKLLQI